MAFFVTLLYIAISLLSPGVLPDAIVSLHVNIILGVLACLAGLPHLTEVKLRATPEPMLVAGIFLAMLMSVIATGWLGHVPTIVGDNLPLVLTFYFVALSCRSIGRIRTLVFVLLFVALFILAHGFMADRAGDTTNQYLITENTPAGAIYRYRGLGVLNDPNDLAQLFTFVIPLLWIWWRKGRWVANFAFTLIPAAVLAVGVYFTHSRGGVVALLAVFLFGLKDKIGLVKSGILAGVLLVGLTALNISGGRGMNEDDGGRVAAWITGLEIFKTHPVFGVGLGNFMEYNETGHTAHNSYILSLSELGLFGYFFWIGSIVSGWSGLSRIVKPQDRADEKKGEIKNLTGRPNLAFAVPNPWFQKTAAKVTSVAMPQAAMAISSVGTYSAIPNAFGKAPAYLAALPSTPSSNASSVEDDLAHTAKTLRVALVGFLTSAFFLSRSFCMVFFILFGMGAALNLMYAEAHPESKFTMKSVNKRIWIALFLSVLFLYLFVRIRGLH